MEASIKIIRSDVSATIVFDRPDIRSPISVAVIDEIEAALNVLVDDHQIRTLVFTGRQGVFASGADLREIGNLSESQAAGFATRGQSLMNRIADLPFITIAAINGYCFGGALDLALACNKRIALKEALFAHPGARLGIITGWGGTQRLPRRVGQASAMELILTAEPISATEALRIGLIEKIVSENSPEFVIS